jgi:Cof subfamily protein (haloacid dehalogenase superfamily)
MVACDLDGTLLRSDGTLSRRTLASIRAAQSAGWAFVMVTARPVRRVVGLASEAELTGLALCSNGAITYDIMGGAIVSDHPIEPAVASDLIIGLRRALEGVYFAFELGLQFGREPAFPRRNDPPHGAVLIEERVGDALELAAEPVHKLIVEHPALEFDRVLELVRSTVVGRAEVTHSERQFVEVSARGVDKASGVRHLARRFGLHAADVVAIGDMPNDLPMLAWAGRAVAVANAHPSVLGAADTVAASNDADGVADVLDALV